MSSRIGKPEAFKRFSSRRTRSGWIGLLPSPGTCAAVKRFSLGLSRASGLAHPPAPSPARFQMGVAKLVGSWNRMERGRTPSTPVSRAVPAPVSDQAGTSGRNRGRDLLRHPGASHATRFMTHDPARRMTAVTSDELTTQRSGHQPTESVSGHFLKGNRHRLAAVVRGDQIVDDLGR